MKKSELILDTSLHTSKQHQLIHAIQEAINHGRFNIGDSLPSVNQVSQELSLSRDTVFKAYSELKRRGIIESTPAKGYRVMDASNKVFLFLDSYSPFKDVLYNSFVESLPGNYQIDLGFHHYNFRIFETVIFESIGKYNMYVIMNFNDEKISDVLRKIDPNKLLILDWGKYKNENYAYVCQDFGEEAYQCFIQANAHLKKFTVFNYVYPRNSVHPKTTEKYFFRFCEEAQLSGNKLESITESSIQKHHAYLVFRQKDLVQILKYAKQKKLVPGKDIGIIAYNDTPLYEVIENGITAISTDFSKMGKRAADYVKNKEKIQEIIPTELILRGSL